ncbi:DegT/DnrJ/EryC1/StrS family aminotransferase [Ammonicoccus fulvus]|uniref:DegT/DnrJ/EryC1/StrS family aminotransferase n=1 Tax=Ammonicoccus fulvus TaxID=3138240 RepID=A0ABZ3FNT7_9ACTN
MNGRIYLSGPDVTDAEEQAIVRAIRSGWVAPLGPEVDAFERELADYSDRAHAVALSSGTAALHLGLIAMGIGPGNVVLTSTMTFAATANAITYTGAEPVFVDCDGTGNIDPVLLAEAVSEFKDQGLAAIVPVDLLGKVADQGAIAEIAEAASIPVLSDAAESLGARRNGRPAASFGAAAAVSFNGNKVMSTSGGGALLTDDAAMAERVRYLATQARQPVVHYEHTEIGYNYRLSNILAALGRAQLARLDAMIERRRWIRSQYRAAFASVPGTTIFGTPDDGDNCWLTSVIVDQPDAGFSSDDLRNFLASRQIEARPLWKPMHLQPVFSQARSIVNGTSERLFRTGLSLPSGSALTDEQVQRIVSSIGDFVAGTHD